MKKTQRLAFCILLFAGLCFLTGMGVRPDRQQPAKQNQPVSQEAAVKGEKTGGSPADSGGAASGGSATSGGESSAGNAASGGSAAPAAPGKQGAGPVTGAIVEQPVNDLVYVNAVRVEDPDVLQGKKPLVVTFSAPMVRDAEQNTPVAEADRPFILKPGIPGEGRWLTASSFAFVPEKEFRRGVRYFLHFKDNLKALDGRTARYLFSFRTESVKLSSLQPDTFNRSKNTLALHFEFSRPVGNQALAEHLTVKDSATGEVLPCKVKKESERSSNHSVTVTLGKYRPKLDVTLRPDADADDAFLGMSEEYASSLSLPEPGSATGVASVEARSGGPSDIKFTYSYSWEDSDGNPSVVFNLSESLRAANLKDFIAIEPESLTYTLDEAGDSLRITEGLRPGMRVTATLKPGLVDAAGRVLREARSDTQVIKDYKPAARFAQHGSFLTPVYGSRVGVNLVNVDQVNVRLRRQYDNNLPFMNLEPSYQARAIMRDMAMKEIPLKAGKKNEVQRRALDVADLAKGKRGVFMVTLDGCREETNDSGVTSMSTENSVDQLVVLTDIGITARSYPSGISVFASSLSTAKPLTGAEVSVYSASNQLIAQGVTGPDGQFVHQRGEEWDAQLKPNVVTVRMGEGDNADISFLPMEQATSKEMPDPALRAYLDKNYEAFVYTPRGVFRPGENVDLKTFVRDAGHMPPAPFPVLFRVVSARGLEMARGSATLSAEGGADFAFKLPPSAPSGEYQAYVEIPGQKNGGLGSCTFSVEDFVPPRLEVKVSPGKDLLTPAETLPVGLSGRYLFGAPGADLNYELGYKVSSKAFTPEGFDGYLFGDAERKFDAQVNLKYLTGKLNGEGVAEAAFKPQTDWLPPALINVLLVAGVQEDGGRWVSQTSTVTYSPTPYLLGLKAEGESFQPGKAVTMNVAAVTPAGKRTASGKLTAEISLVQGNWHTVYRNGRYVSLWDERIVPQDRFPVDAQKGEASFSFTPKQYGRYLVRVATADGAIAASRRLSAVGKDEAGLQDGSGRLDSVELAFDKPDYRVGETAKLSLKAPYAGTLLLGIERGKQLSSQVISLDQPATVIDIPVTADMDPNATVTAWVIRPVLEENKEWFAHRANGMIALQLSKEPHRLKVEASAPERTLPDKPLSVSFTVTDESGAPVQGEFSAAFIDEGILSLTAFATPEPADFFLARRRAVGASFDIFDALLRPEAKATPLLKPGGDGSQYYQGSLSTQQIFLTAYQPVVRTDANGRGEVTFTVPEYSGKGRLMIVGASGKRFASSATQVRVARDVVLEASAPRAVAPGDVFELSVNLFALAPEKDAPALQGKAEVTITAQGPLKLSGDVKKSWPLNPAGDGQGKAPAASAAPAPSAAPVQAGDGKTSAAAAGDGKAPAAVAAPASAAGGKTPPAAQASSAGGKPSSAAPAPAAGAKIPPAAPAAGGKTPAQAAAPGKTPPSAPAATSGGKTADGKAPAAAPSATSQRLAIKGEALQESGVAVITVSVAVPGREDLAFSKTLEVVVRPPYPRASEVKSGMIKAGETMEMAIPGKWLKGSVKASFSIDRSPALAVLPALEYLREYPYGCLEQTTSRAWPYLTLSSMRAVLYPGADAAALANNAKADLADIVARISSMQTPEGGFGLWPGQGAPDPWKSVNATFFLVEAKAGTPVAKATLEGALGYLRRLLAMPPRDDNKAYDYSTKAFAAFVLTRAGDAPLSWIQHLSEREKDMFPSGRIFLAGAKALKAGNPEALKALMARGKDVFDFSGAKPQQYVESMESDLRNRSLLLLMWSLVAPGDPEAARLCASVAETLSAKKRFTPQEAGMAALAFGRYLEKTEASGKPYTARIASEGALLASVTDGSRLVLGGNRLPLLAGGQPPALSVAVGSEAQAYSVYSVRGVPVSAPEPVSANLAVRRVWKDAQGKVIDLSSGAARIKKGDRIIVELTVKPAGPVAHIALSDLLPGGMEVENPRLKTAAGAVADSGTAGGGKNSAGKTSGEGEGEGEGDGEAGNGGDGEEEDSGSGLYIDLREDRLLVFFDRLTEEVTYTYSMRAVSRGSFVLPPLAADAMYSPEVRAVTAGGTVVVE